MPKRLILALLIGAASVGVMVSASAATHPNYPRVGKSCRAGYHGITAKHKVKGVERRYVECIWTAPVKVTVSTTVVIPVSTTPPTSTTQPGGNTGEPTTTTLAPVTTTTVPFVPSPSPPPPVVTTTTLPPTTTTTSTTTTTTTSTTTTTTLAPVTNNINTETQCAESGGFCSEYNSSAETTGADANVYAGPEVDDQSPQVGTVTFTSADHILICTATVYSAADLPSNNARCTGNGGPFEGPLTVNYSGGTVVNGNVTNNYGSSSTVGGSN